MAMALARMAHGPGTLIWSRVFVWQIIAFRISVPGWSAHADGGSGVIAGVVETPWTGSATRDAVRHVGHRAVHTLDYMDAVSLRGWGPVYS